MDLHSVCAHAERPAGALTRRDVALAVLATDPGEVIAGMPGLRRELMAAGNAFTALFWESTEMVLSRMAAGKATAGEVNDWLEATGTHPAAMVGMHVWNPDGERLPEESEIYDLLVKFLEERLTAGDIDPDQLLQDEDARTAHRALQESWLLTPLPDGRTPMHAVEDEADDDFLADWDEYESHALAELEKVLDEAGDRPMPEDEVARAADRLRAFLDSGGSQAELLRACAGLKDRRLPADDAELWLAVASGIFSPRDEPPPGTEDLMSMLCSLEHADWLGIVAVLARGGPGTSADSADLIEAVEDSDDVDVEFEDFDERDFTEGMYDIVVTLWEVIGAVDGDTLTPLGWWGLPEALRRTWSPDD